MKATVLSGVVPRHIFVLLNQNGCPKIEPKFFRGKFVKDFKLGWEIHF